MQGDIERVKFGSLTQTAKVVYAESGFFGFYRGASFRYGRMAIAVGMMDYLQVRMYSIKEEHKCFCHDFTHSM
jgi:hypothetical protein